MSSISISLAHSNTHQHRTYDVTINGFTIQTVVTRYSSVVSHWLKVTDSATINNVVGLGVESRPNFILNARNPIAIVTLCVDNRCLIFQILRRISNCSDLHRFVSESGCVFAGVDVASVAANLATDYELNVRRKVDLRDVVEVILKKADATAMAERYLEMKIETPRWIGSSDWDREWLSDEQVKYAVADAYVAYKLGTVLEAHKHCEHK